MFGKLGGAWARATAEWSSSCEALLPSRPAQRLACNAPALVTATVALAALAVALASRLYVDSLLKKKVQAAIDDTAGGSSGRQWAGWDVE